jgi:hypothetical protein
MFDRIESIEKAIRDKSIESKTLGLMIDFYAVKGKITEDEKVKFLTAMEPPSETITETVTEETTA